MPWESSYLQKMRDYWCSHIAKAQYYAGTTWYDGQIDSKSVVGTTVTIKFTTTDSADLTITKVRLIDTSGTTAYQENRNIVKKSSQGVLIQISAPIIEA